MKPKILIVDDDKNFIKYSIAMPEAGDYELIPAYSPCEALETLEREIVSLIVTDVVFSNDKISGDELASIVRKNFPEIPVILLTAYGTVEKAVNAIKEGAFHYFRKPLNEEKATLFWAAVREALKLSSMQKEVGRYRKEAEFQRRLIYPPLVGQSEAMKAVKHTIAKVAEVDVDVLISGETGTGKELVAREIHASSDRKNNIFLPINCGRPTTNLLQSELFGHEKGSFTGAFKRQIGAFEAVDGGVLFLDEISEASSELQLQLLRVLETKEFNPVGHATGKRTDFRLIAATHRFLEEEIKTGRFRQDLFFRLKVFKIHIAPLRERKDDIPIIADFYLNYFNSRFHRNIRGFSEDADLAMVSYDWPGNVRELKHSVEGAFIHCREDTITADDLFPEKCLHEYPSSFRLVDIERFYIRLALERCGYKVSEAAKLLGVSRKTVYEKIKKYGLGKNK